MIPGQSNAVATVPVAAAMAAGKPAMPRRILIVDDERILAKNLKAYLSRGASDVRTAAGAAQALAMLDAFAPDALVVDFGLPDVDGLRTYAEIIRRQGRKIECVLMSGIVTERLIRDAHDLGIRHIVCKPFPFSELQRLLETRAEASAEASAPVGANE
jgi:DNA-binding response OmpR family regulator